jgi:hypothetical protein
VDSCQARADQISQLHQILSAERRPARSDHHERIRRQQISSRRRHAHQLYSGIEEVDQIRLPRLQPLDELKRLPGQRMEPVRHPHPARGRLITQTMRN